MPNIEEDLNQLEKDIRQLKIEYEQYFGGGRARPPGEIEWRIELILKRYGDRSAEMNFPQRFRYGNLAQTYAKYREIFRKRLRMKEEGTVQRHFGAAARAIEAERAKNPPPAAPGQFSVACSNPDREADKVDALYRAFMEAKQKTGEKTDQMSFDAFREFVRKKTAQMQQEKKCDAVEYVVAVEGGQAKLKARVKE